VHGANRLASNSLLETIVFAKRVVEQSLSRAVGRLPSVADARSLPPVEPGEAPPPTLAELQRLMWHGAGIVRVAEGLQATARTLGAWEAMLSTPRSREERELANLILVGRLVVDAALRRTESRGAHFRSDHPEPDDTWLQHQVYREDAPC
jgi:L-aspartate oxidase